MAAAGRLLNDLYSGSAQILRTSSWSLTVLADLVS